MHLARAILGQPRQPATPPPASQKDNLEPAIVALGDLDGDARVPTAVLFGLLDIYVCGELLRTLENRNLKLHYISI